MATKQNNELSTASQPMASQVQTAPPMQPEPAPPSYYPANGADRGYQMRQPLNNGPYDPANAHPVTPLNMLGETGTWIDCPFCHRRTRTYTQQHNSTQTILVGVLLGIFCLCLACVPCCMEYAQDTEHFCGSCKTRIAFKPYNGIIQTVQPAPSQYANNSAMNGAANGIATGPVNGPANVGS